MPEPSPVAGATSSDPHAWYLTEREAETLRVLNAHHYRAKLFIPCAGNRCPDRMQLHFIDRNNQPLERAYYLCQNRHCIYSREEYALYPDQMRGDYVRDSTKKRYWKTDAGPTRQEAETMI